MSNRSSLLRIGNLSALAMLAQTACPGAESDPCGAEYIEDATWCQDDRVYGCSRNTGLSNDPISVPLRSCETEERCVEVVPRGNEQGVAGAARCATLCPPTAAPLCRAPGEPWEVCAPIDATPAEADVIVRSWLETGAVPSAVLGKRYEVVQNGFDCIPCTSSSDCAAAEQCQGGACVPGVDP